MRENYYVMKYTRKTSSNGRSELALQKNWFSLLKASRWLCLPASFKLEQQVFMPLPSHGICRKYPFNWRSFNSKPLSLIER